MKQFYFIIFSFFCYGGLLAQTITGNFSKLPNQEIKLEGFTGLKTNAISATTTDEKGNFSLKYSKPDYGVGYLMASDNKPFFVILSGENIEIIGEALSSTETINATKGQENSYFQQYAKEHPRREQALSAWNYLEKIYTSDPLFSNQKNTFSSDSRRETSNKKSRCLLFRKFAKRQLCKMVFAHPKISELGFHNSAIPP